MGEPSHVLDFSGYRLDAIDVARFILDLAAFGYTGITMRYRTNREAELLIAGEPARIEFYEADDPKVTIGVIKNFTP